MRVGSAIRTLDVRTVASIAARTQCRGLPCQPAAHAHELGQIYPGRQVMHRSVCMRTRVHFMSTWSSVRRACSVRGR
jgi:hypothetical protein